MKLIHLIVSILLLTLFLPGVSAEVQTLGVFQQDECVELLQTCSNCTYSNISNIFNPTSLEVGSDIIMTKYGTKYNATFCNTTALGKYIVNGYSDVDGFVTVWAYDFLVTPSGTEPSTAQGMVYLLIMIVSLVLFGLTLYGAISLPWKNGRDVEGNIITINDLKYFKIFLIFMSYMFLIWVMFIAHEMASAFLFLSIAKGIFNAVMTFLLSFLLPLFIATMFIALINVLNDKKLHKLLIRGVPAR